MFSSSATPAGAPVATLTSPRAVRYQPRGRHTLRAKIVQYLRTSGATRFEVLRDSVASTDGAVGSALDFLTRRGVVARLDRGLYAIAGEA